MFVTVLAALAIPTAVLEVNGCRLVATLPPISLS